MPTVSLDRAPDRHPANCMELVIASVESFAGEAQDRDRLMLVSRQGKGVSRFGQAVFLREEIDAGTIHALFPIPRGGLARLVKRLSAKAALPLRVEDGFWLSGIPARADAADDAVLVAIDSAAVEDLQMAAKDRGLILSSVGEVLQRQDPIEDRPGLLATDTVQSAFWARRRFWREPMLA